MNAVLRKVSRFLPVLAAGSLLYANVIPSERTYFHRSYSLPSNGHVIIQNLYGDVSIMAWDRDEVLVEAIKHSADPRRLNEAQVVVEPSIAGLSIRTQYSSGGATHPTSVEYRITVPRSATLDQVRLINGGLWISGLSGGVTASAVNGSIRAEKLAGHADLSTINGKLSAEFNRVSAANHISLSSINGPISLSLPSGTGATVNAHNQSGGIQSDFGRAIRGDEGLELHTRINKGGAEIRVRNVNGGISIHAALDKRACPNS
ncbi:MAG TPA: DUF4097 family beta strand repeat-containing protein [Verrucomicrobiae bacterium]|nr:DUF4097 family beta strand repeat-containing protein [Verrucomicrobiae bacterium]